MLSTYLTPDSLLERDEWRFVLCSVSLPSVKSLYTNKREKEKEKDMKEKAKNQKVTDYSCG